MLFKELLLCLALPHCYWCCSYIVVSVVTFLVSILAICCGYLLLLLFMFVFVVVDAFVVDHDDFVFLLSYMAISHLLFRYKCKVP